MKRIWVSDTRVRLTDDRKLYTITPKTTSNMLRLADVNKILLKTANGQQLVIAKQQRGLR